MANIEVRWVDNSANEEKGFHVYRSIDGAELTALGDVGPDVITFMDSDVKPGLYKYAVSAFNDAGESARIASNEVTVPIVTPGTPAPPWPARACPSPVGRTTPGR